MKRERFANQKLTSIVAMAHDARAREVDSPPAPPVATSRVRAVDILNTHWVETPIAREIHREVQQQERHEARREVCRERPAADSDSRTGNAADNIFTGSYLNARDWLPNCPR